MAVLERAGDGLVIHILRWQRGWTLRDLEEKTGIPEATLSRYERRTTIPSGRLRVIARAFDLSLGDFDGLTQRYSPTGLFLNALGVSAA